MYEVYMCKLNDEVLYVGQGASGRHKHCNSGSSHVYELNKLHFQGKTFDVDPETGDFDISKPISINKTKQSVVDDLIRKGFDEDSSLKNYNAD